MNKKTISLGLLLVIVFQTVVLAAEYINAVYPLWTGQEIRLKTIPVDPRSLFRGNYARLNYDISQIETTNFVNKDMLRNEEVVYVGLKQGENKVYVYSGISLEQPQTGIYIKGRLENYTPYAARTNVSVKYGIEAWFAPKDKALQLERDLRNGGVAVVMVASNGKATLKAIEPLKE